MYYEYTYNLEYTVKEMHAKVYEHDRQVSPPDNSLNFR